MAITFHNFSGSMPATLTVATTAFTTYAINDLVGIAEQTKSASAENVFRIEGLAKGVPKSTAAAWVVGDALYFNGTAFAVATATTKVHAHAYAAATAASTTGNIMLRPLGSLAVS